VALLVLFGVGAANLWPYARPAQQVASRATSQTTSQATIIPPTPVIPAGWEHLGPADASDIAFSRSQPFDAYACGPSAPPTASNPPNVGIHTYFSSTYGHSWTQFATPTLGVACRITVDPLNALDVVLFVQVSSPCSPFSGEEIWRSADGGQDWTQMALPQAPSGVATIADMDAWAWAGSTLFVEAAMSCALTPTLLAASAKGGPFVWIPSSALLAGVQSFGYLGTVQSSLSTLYVGLETESGCPTCLVIKRTTNDGRAWTTFAPTYLDQPLALRGVGTGAGEPNGVLFASPVTGAPFEFLVSSDGGATWQPLPPFGVDVNGLDVGQIEAAPEGSFYAALAYPDASGATAAGIYLLAPGKSAWTRVATFAAGQLVMSYGDQGTAMGFWALVSPIVIFHQP
jgi:hypothetical protein